MGETGSSAAWSAFFAAINLLDGDSLEESGIFGDHILVVVSARSWYDHQSAFLKMSRM